MTKQLNIRLSAEMTRKLDALTGVYGSKTASVVVALDRLHKEECPVEKLDITIKVRKGDVEDWLNPDGDHSYGQVESWCELYANELQMQMARLNPDATVSVDWDTARSYEIVIGGYSTSNYDREYEVGRKLDEDYHYVAGRLANFEWLPHDAL